MRIAMTHALGAALAIATMSSPNALARTDRDASSGRNGARPPRAGPQSVIMFFRHGIRSPLPGEIPHIDDRRVFANWTAPPGSLTRKGYRTVRSMGGWLGRDWCRQGMMPPRCPAAEEIMLRSNNVPRTIESAAALAAGLSPGCAIPVDHNPLQRPDPIFDPIAAGEARIGADSLPDSLRDTAALWSSHAAPVAKLQSILGCGASGTACGLRALPGAPATVDSKGIHLDARSRGYAGAAQALLLQYAEGLPMPVVAGRAIDAAGIAQLSVLHAVPFELEARQPAVAAQLAAPFLREVRRHVSAKAAPTRVEVFVGHDNVLSAVTAALGIDFQAKGYGRNDPPIGGGFGFEMIADARGARRVRGVYVAQSPTQLRREDTLTGRARPWKRYFAFPGCKALPDRGCPLPVFVGLLDRIERQRSAPVKIPT